MSQKDYFSGRIFHFSLSGLKALNLAEKARLAHDMGWFEKGRISCEPDPKQYVIDHTKMAFNLTTLELIPFTLSKIVTDDESCFHPLKPESQIYVRPNEIYIFKKKHLAYCPDGLWSNVVEEDNFWLLSGWNGDLDYYVKQVLQRRKAPEKPFSVKKSDSGAAYYFERINALFSKLGALPTITTDGQTVSLNLPEKLTCATDAELKALYGTFFMTIAKQFKRPKPRCPVKVLGPATGL